jgi:hypothetical protein
MKRLSPMFLLGLTLVACTYSKTAPPEAPAPSPAVQTSSPAQSAVPKGKVLVEALPAGVEGLELRNGELRLLGGYEFVEQPENAFKVMRARDGQQVGIGGCGCSRLGLCKPVLSPDGIIVCQVEGLCIGSCGLAVTAGGVSTDIIMY